MKRLLKWHQKAGRQLKRVHSIDQAANAAHKGESMHMSGRNISFAYESGKALFQNLDIDIPKGKVTTLIGPNGCGKSTLLGILTRKHHLAEGNIFMEGLPIEAMKRRVFSQKAAVLHQHNGEEVSVTVRELAAYGRMPYEGWGQKADTQKEEIIDWALRSVGLWNIQDKLLTQLSGGQRQRAWLAMSLCQRPEILFLDEPTTYLDIYHQLELLELVKRLNQEYGTTIVMVLHDINQALNYSDHIIVMKQGKIVRAGTPEEVAEERLIKEVYEVKSKINKEGQDKYLIDFYS